MDQNMKVNGVIIKFVAKFHLINKFINFFHREYIHGQMDANMLALGLTIIC